jgi:N-acetylmuramic acid 6-phosphate (MurNAc-6-P) etherase
VIGIASNMPSPLLSIATHPIHLATGAEVIAGSTRMGAGTAQNLRSACSPLWHRSASAMFMAA